MVSINSLLEEAHAEAQRVGWDVARLPEPLRSAYLISTIEFEIANGGVYQWLTNESGRWARETAVAFEAIRALRCAELVRKILTPFDPDGPPKDAELRVWSVDAVPDRVQEEWSDLGDQLLARPDDIEALLERFAEGSVRRPTEPDRG